MAKLSIQDRFWSKVHKTDTCWLWIAVCNKDGYGQFALRASSLKAHRVAWELTFGLIPLGMCVLHRCDVPQCVNPSHLFLGTQLDNVADRSAKGRAACGVRNGSKTRPDRVLRGENQGRAKLTNAEVIAIRSDDRTQKEIAACYGVERSTIGYIKRRASWAHI